MPCPASGQDLPLSQRSISQWIPLIDGSPSTETSLGSSQSVQQPQMALGCFNEAAFSCLSFSVVQSAVQGSEGEKSGEPTMSLC